MSKSSYILLADYAKSAGLSLEEARELVINGCGTLRIADEIEDIDVRKLV